MYCILLVSKKITLFYETLIEKLNQMLKNA